MELYEKKYYLPKKKLTKRWLEDNGFVWSRILSDKDSDVYIHRFTVWRYSNAGVIEGEIRVDTGDGEVFLGCFDYGTRYCYAGWYYREYGKNAVIDEIDKKFINEMNKLGVKERDK